MLSKLFGRQTVTIDEANSQHATVAIAPALAEFKNTQKNASLKLMTPVVAVLGAKGGVGASTIAVNLATSLAFKHISTTIIDGNLQQPDIANLVGLEPLHTLAEFVTRIPYLDRELFEACCLKAIDNDLSPSLISPPLERKTALKMSLTDLACCLNLIRSYSNFWVIDLPKYLDRHLVTLTDMCDRIVLVFEATVLGVATCKRWLDVFRELGFRTDRIICVLNRSGSKYRGVEQQLGHCFTDEQIFRVPNASALAWECSTRGLPIVAAHPAHPYSKAIAHLAEHLSQLISVS